MSGDVKNTTKRHRVQKIIANAGITSRRKAEELIAQDRVTVNGKKITLGDKADPFKDKIHIDGKLVKLKRKLYFMFNKPPDCLTTLKDPKGRKTIFHYIKEKERLIPIGRLDFKTSGLLLLTNDGDFANKIMHPRYEVNKNYVVTLNKGIGKEGLDSLRRGVLLEDGRTKPVSARTLTPDKKVISIKIHEGKNRVVRRMLEALGFRVIELRRTAIGDLLLGSLEMGRYRKLVPQEIRMLSS